jgi:tripartite motif-containing protein 71
VVDSLNRRVQAFDLNGAHKFSFGKHGSGDSQFMIPAGISAGRDGFVYVTDAGTGRIQKFDETGKWVSQFGRRPPPLAPRQADRPLDSRDLPAVAGARMGELWKPQGIAQAEDGRVFVIDYGNHRGQIFAADGEWLVTFGAGRAYTRTRRPPEE